jgi:hypothetical protein
VTALLIQLTKRADGGATLRCRRADGSVTWQNHQGTRAAFFPGHDLTHFAVESELPGAVAFYGLIASGWDIEDTTGKGARGPLPPEAVMVEHIVGLLDLERGSGHRMSGAEFRSALTDAGKPAPLLDDETLARCRARRSELIHRWRDLPPGATLELGFGQSSPFSGASP